MINQVTLLLFLVHNWSFYKVIAHLSKEQYFFVFLNGTHRCWSLPFSQDLKLGIVIE